MNGITTYYENTPEVLNLFFFSSSFWLFFSQLEQEEDVSICYYDFFCCVVWGAERRIGEWTTPTSDVGVEWER